MKTILWNANDYFSKKRYSEALDLYKTAHAESNFKSHIEFLIKLCESKLSEFDSKKINPNEKIIASEDNANITIFVENDETLKYYTYAKVSDIKNTEEKGFYGWLESGECDRFKYQELINNSHPRTSVLFSNLARTAPFFYEILNLIEYVVENKIIYLNLNSSSSEPGKNKKIVSYIEFTHTSSQEKIEESPAKNIEHVFLNVNIYKTIHSIKKKIIQFERSENTSLMPTCPKILKIGWCVDDFIEHCLADAHVLNLDHRIDRKVNTEKQFSKIGICPTFVSATYGVKSDKCKSLLNENITFINKHIKDKKFIFKYHSEMYTKYDCEEKRLGHYYHTQGKIMSLGSIGYMLSYKKALIQACMSNAKSDYCAIFDDDVLLHKDWENIIELTIRSLPKNFTILSLGSIQYNWQPETINCFSETLYQCLGTGVASHATVYRKDVAKKLLKEIDAMQLPFDIGALHYFKKMNFDTSFTIIPNLFIQDSSESDIADTLTQLETGTKEDNIYRWNLSSYIGN